MSLINRRSSGIYAFLYLVVIAMICQWSKANDYSCTTDEVKFKCQSNGKCIPKKWECDGESDCQDKSDESNCASCDDDLKFSCGGDGKCIPEQWRCDGSRDCNDGSDESPDNCANRNCTSDEFRCAKDQTCISKDWVCDHEVDCDDGSDEVNCPVKPCPSSYFKCDNNKCIDQKWRCDHDNDCDDDSDEKNCSNSYRKCDERWEFTCNNQRCIQKEAFCDNHYDCNDKSDEPVDCTSPNKHKKKCPEGRFDCKDGNCIVQKWVCDGYSDCSSNEDEIHCSPICPFGQMRCGSGSSTCISKSLKCDGKEDCDGGADEEDCDPLFGCKEGQFECSKTRMCINESLVCDGKTDCKDGTDESDLCGKNECREHNHGCEHKCEDLKIGYRCLCADGYELADDTKSCQDVNECKEFGKCSQICINVEGGGYKCDCVAGYRLERKDRRTCKARERHPYLVFSDHYSIRKLMLHKPQFFGIVANLAGTIAVDYHFGEDFMYWTDMKNGTIKRTNLNGSDKNFVKKTIITGVQNPDGIAVDWVTGKLYWTDAGTKRIEVSNLHGEHRRALIKTGLDMPRAIVLHPSYGEMFWTDWGLKPKIEKCGMDGDPASRKAIVTTRILWPNALTIDYTINSIWWVDAKLDLIEHCNLDGKNRRVILANDKIFHPFSISVFEDHVYWSDWYKTAIYKANKFTGQNVTLLKEGLVHTLGISMIHPQRQPASFNFCLEYNGGCSNLCLLSAQSHKKTQRYSCACPEGVDMLPDNKTCNIPDKLRCETGRCNNGTCTPGNQFGGPVCQCKEGFTGDRCESKKFKISAKADDSSNSNANAITIGISVGVVSIIFIIFGVVSYIFYKKIQKRYNPNTLKFTGSVYEETTVAIEGEGCLRCFKFRKLQPDQALYTQTTETNEVGGGLLRFKFRKLQPDQKPIVDDRESVDM